MDSPTSNVFLAGRMSRSRLLPVLSAVQLRGCQCAIARDVAAVCVGVCVRGFIGPKYYRLWNNVDSTRIIANLTNSIECLCLNFVLTHLFVRRAESPRNFVQMAI